MTVISTTNIFAVHMGTSARGKFFSVLPHKEKELINPRLWMTLYDEKLQIFFTRGCNLQLQGTTQRLLNIGAKAVISKPSWPNSPQGGIFSITVISYHMTQPRGNWASWLTAKVCTQNKFLIYNTQVQNRFSKLHKGFF